LGARPGPRCQQSIRWSPQLQFQHFNLNGKNESITLVPNKSLSHQGQVPGQGDQDAPTVSSVLINSNICIFFLLIILILFKLINKY
jgi:hypothetical protein